MDLITLFNSFLNGQDVLYKIALIIFMILYSLFALILFIQVNSLIKVVNQIKFTPVFKLVTVLNVVASLMLIIYTIFTI
jgi:hypothetical protein